MNAELFKALVGATRVDDVEAAVAVFESSHPGVIWLSLGRENNRGAVEAASDPGRSLIERLTNGFDAILEAEWVRHKGRPECASPREAAEAWLGLPSSGLAGYSRRDRQRLADNLSIYLDDGEGSWSERTVVVRDRGTGILPDQMPGTILSLNESNKSRKKYLIGAYGQGGSSTFASSKYTFIASRFSEQPAIGFTVVKFLEPPADDELKVGNYVYLALDGKVLTVDLPLDKFATGTHVQHFAYDLSHYGGALGPGSVYGLLNQVLFDPVVPLWLDNKVHGWRRTIKGSRNALNGAVDEGDENQRGPDLSHNVPMFFVPIGDYGMVGIEYWVLQGNTKRPSASFVNPSKPIILTVNGQSHAELSQVLVRKGAELPYLRQRLICHVDCNKLTPDAKRVLFVSNREEVRRGQVYTCIEEEIIRVLKSDDDLRRLNDEARERGLQQQDEEAQREMQSEVARLLRLHGASVEVGGGSAAAEVGSGRRVAPRGPRSPLTPIVSQEPPTYVRIVWDENEPISFYKDQRRYVRVETDANSSYHNAADLSLSRMNFIVNGVAVALVGTTPLKGGRMRAIFAGLASAAVGDYGMIRVELSRPGQPVLSDERLFEIVKEPDAKPAGRKVSVPKIDPRPVNPGDEMWDTLDWPQDPAHVASESQIEDGVLVVYYSTAFPNYANQFAAFEKIDPALAGSFRVRYTIWLAVHSLLLQRDQEAAQPTGPVTPDQDVEPEELRERQERVRMATVSAMFALREVKDLKKSAAVEAE